MTSCCAAIDHWFIPTNFNLNDNRFFFTLSHDNLFPPHFSVFRSYDLFTSVNTMAYVNRRPIIYKKVGHCTQPMMTGITYHAIQYCDSLHKLHVWYSKYLELCQWFLISYVLLWLATKVYILQHAPLFTKKMLSYGYRNRHYKPKIDGLVQDCSISSALAMEILQPGDTAVL